MSLSDNYIQIDTPENVAFGYDLAGIGSRFMAASVDTILILLIQILVNVTAFIIIQFVLGDLDAIEEVLVWVAAGFFLLSFALFWGYYILFEMVLNIYCCLPVLEKGLFLSSFLFNVVPHMGHSFAFI